MSKKFISLPELQALANEYASTNADYYVNSRDMQFPTRRGFQFPAEDNGPLFANGDTPMVGMYINDHAMTQLAARLDAPPMRWLDDRNSCPDPLWLHNMNWLASNRENARYMVRQHDNYARAVLSDQYTPFDLPEAVQMMVEAAGAAEAQVKVGRYTVGDVSTGYMLMPNTVIGLDPREGRANRELHLAAFFHNSEIGTGKWKILPGVYTGVCDNGAIFGYMSRSQFGEIDPELFTHGASITHRWIDRDGIRNQIANALITAFNMSAVAGQAYIQSYAVPMTTERVENEIARLVSKYNFTVVERENWLRAVTTEVSQRGSDMATLGDVVNGLTVLSHSQESVERRRDYEVVAGNMIMAEFPNLFNEMNAEDLVNDRPWVQSRF